MGPSILPRSPSPVTFPSTNYGAGLSMPLSLGDTQVINQLADSLYPFLPGKAHPYADPKVSFRGIARDLKIGRFWVDGSKLPAITQLLSSTFQSDKGRFATLVLEVVRRGLNYREGKDPVKREELQKINELLLKLSLRIKDLNDPKFLESLPAKVRRTDTHPDPGRPATTPHSTLQTAPGPGELGTLKLGFGQITTLEPHPRGFAFEKFLNDLFGIFNLAPRGSFRLVGEQIDGSFLHAGHTYLVEAKWQGAKLGETDLLAFSGKVAGKAQWSRGAYISLSGYSEDGLDAFSRGKQTNIICFDGLDLHYILEGHVSLIDLILMKARRAAESNAAFVSVRSLVPHLR